jgi:starch-binding outer membrane protein, SusD/RagB family
MFHPANNATSLTWNLATNNDEFTRTTDELPGETNFNKEWGGVSFTNGHALQYFGTKVSTSLGNNTWTRMKQINLFLDQIDKHGLPVETRNELKGQIFFWRAWQYFDLVRLYGGVPLVLKPQDPIANNE